MGRYKEPSKYKVFGDYGLPKFWGEYTRKRGRFDKKSNFFPLHMCMYENYFFVWEGRLSKSLQYTKPRSCF